MSEKEGSNSNISNDLDYVLCNVGEFGKFQIVHFILMIIPIVFSATYAVEFIVTTATDDYRQVSIVFQIQNEYNISYHRKIKEQIAHI